MRRTSAASTPAYSENNMQSELQIAVDGLPHSDALDQHIREQAAKLEKLFPRLTTCRVVVSAPHRHHQQGDLFAVRINAGYPGGEAVVDHHRHEDVYVALRDAFAAAQRELGKSLQRYKGGGPDRSSIKIGEPAQVPAAAQETDNE
jgi:ribosomal subunit interface protein